MELGEDPDKEPEEKAEKKLENPLAEKLGEPPTKEPEEQPRGDTAIRPRTRRRTGAPRTQLHARGVQGEA